VLKKKYALPVPELFNNVPVPAQGKLQPTSGVSKSASFFLREPTCIKIKGFATLQTHSIPSFVNITSNWYLPVCLEFYLKTFK
jgi:hypothetical protein